jgi:hypothetical protein
MPGCLSQLTQTREQSFEKGLASIQRRLMERCGPHKAARNTLPDRKMVSLMVNLLISVLTVKSGVMIEAQPHFKQEKAA